MSLLAQRFREDAQGLIEAAGAIRLDGSVRRRLLGLLEISDVARLHQEIEQLVLSLPEAGDQTALAATVVAQVNAHTAQLLADVLEVQAAMGDHDNQMAKRVEAHRFNDSLRKAAANGDWDSYDRLIAEQADKQRASAPASDVDSGQGGAEGAAPAEPQRHGRNPRPRP